MICLQRIAGDARRSDGGGLPDLVLSVRDRHLDVMTWLSARGRTYTVTSSVKVHNLFGRLYMLPVAIAHRAIVAADLRRLKKMTSTG